MNLKQAIEYSNRGKRLPVCEYFYSLQGEGYNSGRAVVFIRLSGCDVGCSWCDTKNSWSVEEKDFLSVDAIIALVLKSGINCVVITGGEPTLYYLEELLRELLGRGIEVCIETSGTGIIPDNIDWVTLSPKRNKLPIKENFSRADELKIVISSIEDFAFAESCAEMITKECKLYLQPQWGSQEAIALAVEYIKKSNKWRLSLQTHKYIDIE